MEPSHLKSSFSERPLADSNRTLTESYLGNTATASSTVDLNIEPSTMEHGPDGDAPSNNSGNMSKNMSAGPKGIALYYRV